MLIVWIIFQHLILISVSHTIKTVSTQSSAQNPPGQVQFGFLFWAEPGVSGEY